MGSLDTTNVFRKQVSHQPRYIGYPNHQLPESAKRAKKKGGPDRPVSTSNAMSNLHRRETLEQREEVVQLEKL